jgi:hypothetical protein
MSVDEQNKLRPDAMRRDDAVRGATDQPHSPASPMLGTFIRRCLADLERAMTLRFWPKKL